jgi:L-ascorbate metabolism protein UlaG (beta-lactamase superfamily)
MLKRFQNTDGYGNIIKHEIGLLDLFRWRLRLGEYTNEKYNPWPKHIPEISSPAVANIPAQSQELIITFINHSTFLIQASGLNIITDPVFSRCAGPFGSIGPKRALPCGVELKDLPKIDYILLSHNHYDHMDIPSLRRIAQRDKPLIITGINNGFYLRNLKSISPIIELNWGGYYKAENKAVVHYLRCKHWSHRLPFDRNWALWGAFAIEFNDKKIYFAGDTAYHDHFKEAGQRFNGFDVSLLPIGAYRPRCFMRYFHNNPEEAVQAHLDLKSKLSIAMHFGTFQLTDEAYHEPLQDLKLAMTKYNIAENAFIHLAHGRSHPI